MKTRATETPSPAAFRGARVRFAAAVVVALAALGALAGCPPPGEDAGPSPDAGHSDAGPRDAGPEDAGASDAGSPVCGETDTERVRDGDVVVSSSASLIDLAAVECVAGDLLVELTLIDELSLPALARVGGTLRLESNTLLTGLQLGALKEVRGDFVVRDNRALPDLAGLPLLADVGGDLVVGGGLSFYGNRLLTDLTGLESIERVGGDLIVGNNPALTSLTGFSLAELEGGLRVIDSPSLASLAALAALVEVGGDLEVRQNPLLTDLTGLDALTGVDGDLLIGGRDEGDGNLTLTTLAQLVTLDRVGGELVVANNPALPQCQANALAQRLAGAGGVGGTFIDGNAPCNDAGP